MRELALLRAQGDGRVHELFYRQREADVVRSDYLSKHASNPYRRGLELFEKFTSQVWECLATGGVTEEILFGPVRIFQLFITAHHIGKLALWRLEHSSRHAPRAPVAGPGSRYR